MYYQSAQPSEVRSRLWSSVRTPGQGHTWDSRSRLLPGTRVVKTRTVPVDRRVPVEVARRRANFGTGW